MPTIESSSPLEVLLVAAHFPPVRSGRASLLGELVRRQPSGKVRVSTPHRPGARAADAQFECEVYRARRLFLGRARLGVVLWRAELRQLCRRRPPGLVVAAGVEPEGAMAAAIGRALRVPYLLQLERPELAGVRRQMARGSDSGRRMGRIVAGAEAVLVPTRTCRFEAYKLGVMPHRIHQVSAGVSLERFRPGEPTPGLAERFGLLGRPLLLSVAGSNPSRDPETLLRALALVRGRRRRAQLALVGFGAEALSRSLARKLGLQGAVRFLENVPGEELADLYRLADIFVHAHREDPEAGRVQGLTMTLLEAIASGLPIAATRTPITEETVPHEEAGLLVEPGAHAKLAGAIQDLLRARAQGHAPSPQFHERFRERHGATEAAQRWREFLEALYHRRLRLAPVPFARGAEERRPAAPAA